MLAYAANRPVAGKRESSPNAFLVIVAVHVAALAAVMSAKMELPQRMADRPTIIDLIQAPSQRTPIEVEKTPTIPRPVETWVDHTMPEVPTPDTGNVALDTSGPNVVPAAAGSEGAAVIPEMPKPTLTPIHRDARLLTPASELKPPYPASKLLTEEEAILTLRLSIDERGRVVAVEPIGHADRDFLQAARHHLIAHWRYQPAMDDGRAVSTSLTITLHFMLDG
ncbi:MAG: energy transducer TonB [Sphingomicrobium sp.]